MIYYYDTEEGEGKIAIIEMGVNYAFFIQTSKSVKFFEELIRKRFGIDKASFIKCVQKGERITILARGPLLIHESMNWRKLIQASFFIVRMTKTQKADTIYT